MKSKCGGMSAGEMTMSSGSPISIANGLDISLSTIGDIKGQFISPTETSGTIHLDMKITAGMGSSISSDLGIWNRTAEAK